MAVRPRMNENYLLDAFHRLLMKHGKPEFIRSDNGPEFIVGHLHGWLKKVSIQPMQIYLWSLWGNGYNERFNGTFRREALNAEWFHSTRQAQVAINVWLKQYNRIRPRHALGLHTSGVRNLIREQQN